MKTASLSGARRLDLGGPGPFGPLYLAMACQGAALIHAIYAPIARPDRLDQVWPWVLWLSIGLAAMFAWAARPGIQDWYSVIRPPERLIPLVIVGSFFFAPALVGRNPFPEGFAFGLLPMLVFAADAKMARRYVVWALLGFWAAAAARPETNLIQTLAFVFLMLWSIVLIHFAFIGSPFGLRGWWVVRRALVTAILYSIPAGLAATLAWWAWPRSSAQSEPFALPPAEDVMTSLVRLDAIQWEDLIVRSGIAVAVMIVSLAALFVARRFFLRRARPRHLPEIMGAEVAEIEYVERGAPAPGPAMGGRRGMMIRFWKRWAASRAGDGVDERLGHETAAEFLDRLPLATEPARSRAATITRLFEQAHYAPAEPSEENLETLRRAVEEDLAALNERRI